MGVTPFTGLPSTATEAPGGSLTTAKAALAPSRVTLTTSPAASGSFTTRLTSRRPCLRKVSVTCSGQGLGKTSSPSVTTPESLPSTSTAAPAGSDRTRSPARRDRRELGLLAAAGGANPRPGPGPGSHATEDRPPCGRSAPAPRPGWRGRRAPCEERWAAQVGACRTVGGIPVSALWVGGTWNVASSSGNTVVGGSGGVLRRCDLPRGAAQAPGGPPRRSCARSRASGAARGCLRPSLPSGGAGTAGRPPPPRPAGSGSVALACVPHDLRELVGEGGGGRGAALRRLGEGPAHDLAHARAPAERLRRRAARAPRARSCRGSRWRPRRETGGARPGARRGSPPPRTRRCARPAALPRTCSGLM